MNQLDLIKATGKQPYYDFIDLAEFRPELEGRIRVRVNPPRAMRKRMDAANKRREELKAARELAGEDADALAALDAQEKELGAEFNALAAALIPQNGASDTPITPEQLDEFLNGDDETDDTLQRWFMEQVWTKVYEYFLSPVTLRTKSKAGAIR